ncbi:type II toxin-antitoxin system VapB family antitoxin [Acerihabitans sp. TG2]|uniref:type II toxin-antitoxin system VapB family antitoxin n=1 Tax=Acerihabitans sp. TG2 TaxID=3096008 RepID=UPI002B227EAB|nr:type II toxin-antitoxin system VapB family antitoxin [Acerihabitans sp. TG2]MEA9392858.1 type II toxin-antitoxin system VapB family antitoxin [Acerihabitans sp. TG2]
MTHSTVFINNRSQAVRIPVELRFADDVKIVNVRTVGKDRIISPVESTWNSFFLTDPAVSDDFMEERSTQEQQEREPF